VEEQYKDFGVDQAIDVGNSHLRGRSVSFKCKWLSLILIRNGENVEFWVKM